MNVFSIENTFIQRQRPAQGPLSYCIIAYRQALTERGRQPELREFTPRVILKFGDSLGHTGSGRGLGKTRKCFKLSRSPTPPTPSPAPPGRLPEHAKECKGKNEYSNVTVDLSHVL